MTIFPGVVIVQIVFFSSARCLHPNKNPKELLVDISHKCKNNYTTSIHLPYGAGSADSRTILLNSVASLIRSCSVLVVGPHPENNCKDKCITAFVVEIFNFQQTRSFCRGGGILLSDSKEFADVSADICANHSKNEYEHLIHAYLIHTRRFTMDINFVEFAGSIKMIATSAKYLSNYGNCTKNEIYCVLKGETFCIDKFLECDGNNNCGTPNQGDEYCTNLHIQDNMLFIIIYGTFLAVVVIFIFVQILRQCVPSVPNHFFIFNEDQEYNFVLTSQSLPPLQIRTIPENKHTDRPQRSSKATDTQIY
ncbi:uncharacterized protein LOC135120021 isoform X2 [Zophobas morio]|uniref:uncharacterized protein LOC135120021 isoform X2 n=1 Tax=Zophobas morio TaxID=2755281 RepID=UPI003082E81B